LIDPPPLGQNITLIVEARDGSGNVSTYTAKGTMSAFSLLMVPIVRR
jgi:hypothetical protein